MKGPVGQLRRIYVLLSEGTGHGTLPKGALTHLLRYLDHVGDLYVISEDLLRDARMVLDLVEEARQFLIRYGFCRLNVRPVHPLRVGSGKGLMDFYRVVAHLGRTFHREALEHQVASRWVVLPVLRARSEEEALEAMGMMRLLRRHLMMPTLAMTPICRARGRIEPEQEPDRIMLEEGSGPVEALIDNALFDDLHQRALSSGGAFSVQPCGSVLIDCVRGWVRRCPAFDAIPLSWVLSGGTGPGLGKGHDGPSDAWERLLGQWDDHSRCMRCWEELPTRIRKTIEWNRMEEEGGRLQLLMALSAISREDLEAAERQLRTVSESNCPAHLRAEGFMYMGMIHLKRGDLDRARTTLTEARSLLPKSGSIAYHLGRCEFEDKDYIKASEFFLEALNLGVPPGLEDEVRLHLGICHARLEEFSEALDVLESVWKVSVAALFYKGVALAGLQRPNEALRPLRDALSLGPAQDDLSAIHFYIGHCLKEMGQFREAVAALRMSLRADPTAYEAWNLLGYCLFRLKRHEEAIGAFLKALELNPRSALDHANIGSNLRDLGDLEMASRWYRRALSLDPTLGWVRENLQKVEQAIGHKGKGIGPEGTHE